MSTGDRHTGQRSRLPERSAWSAFISSSRSRTSSRYSGAKQHVDHGADERRDEAEHRRHRHQPRVLDPAARVLVRPVADREPEDDEEEEQRLRVRATPGSRRSRRAARCSYQQFADQEPRRERQATNRTTGGSRRGSRSQLQSARSIVARGGRPWRRRRGQERTRSPRRRVQVGEEIERAGLRARAGRARAPAVPRRGVPPPSPACESIVGPGRRARRHASARGFATRRDENVAGAGEPLEHAVRVLVSERSTRRHHRPPGIARAASRRPPACGRRPTARRRLAAIEPPGRLHVDPSPIDVAPEERLGRLPRARRSGPRCSGRRCAAHSASADYDDSTTRDDGELLAGNGLARSAEHRPCARARRSSDGRPARETFVASSRPPSPASTAAARRHGGELRERGRRQRLECVAPTSSAAGRMRHGALEAVCIGVEPLVPPETCGEVYARAIRPSSAQRGDCPRSGRPWCPRRGPTGTPARVAELLEQRHLREAELSGHGESDAIQARMAAPSGHVVGSCCTRTVVRSSSRGGGQCLTFPTSRTPADLDCYSSRSAATYDTRSTRDREYPCRARLDG